MNEVFCRILRRSNRFSVLVSIDGCVEEAYLPNPGRLRELIIPGRLALVRRVTGHRKTEWDMIAVRGPGRWISVDSRLPNQIFRKHFPLPGFEGFSIKGFEPYIGDRRLDFSLTPGTTVVEVKSCTLVIGCVGYFPDSPTSRGRDHLRKLIKLVKEGWRAVVVFIIQRDDAFFFSPNHATDPDFAELLMRCRHAGVQILAYRCRVTVSPFSVVPVSRVPVVLKTSFLDKSTGQISVPFADDSANVDSARHWLEDRPNMMIGRQNK